MASAQRRKSISVTSNNTRRRSDSSISQRRESLSDRTVSQEKALEISFWDGIFGVVGIRNHTEIDYTDPEIFNHELETSEQLLKVKNEVFCLLLYYFYYLNWYRIRAFCHECRTLYILSVSLGICVYVCSSACTCSCLYVFCLLSKFAICRRSYITTHHFIFQLP